MTNTSCDWKALGFGLMVGVLMAGCTQVGDSLFTIQVSEGPYAKVLEVVEDKCAPCHTAGASGGLDLSSPEGFEAGGSSGAAYVACDPDASLVVCRMEGSDCGAPMPLGGSVSDEEIDVFRDYISTELCGDVTAFSDILGIFEDNCTGCHIGGSSGGLDLSTEAGLIAGGNSGAAVVACDPDNSLLICKITGSDCGSQMPLGGPALSEPDIALIRSYIEGGAGNPQACGSGCSDGVQNGDETGVDCGGSCAACPDIVVFDQVSSIFIDRKCTLCHNQEGADAKLAFDFSYENMLKQPGDDGAPRDAPLIIPCDSENSLLFKLVSGPVTLSNGTEIPQMPLGETPLTPEQLELVKRWIDDGAQDVIDPSSTCPTP